jgi:CPA1 family monovalent cation:H+ antiporter
MTADRFDLLLAQRLILRDLDGFIDRRIRRIHGRRVAELLHELLARRGEGVETALEGLRLQYPGYAEEIERRFIRRTALRLEEWEYATMRRDGLIGAELHSVLMQDIASRRAEAEGRPVLDVAVQKDELVRRFPLFAGMEDGLLRKLIRTLRTRYVNAGDIVIRKDGAIRSVYFVASGAIELEAAGQTWRLGPGEMFGQLSILTSRRRRTEAKAITPTILLVLDEVRFRRVLKRSPGLRAAVIESARKRGLAEDLLKLPEFAGEAAPREAA